MNANATRNQEVDEQIDDRDRRALEQYLTVLDSVGDVRDRRGEYLVVSESGSEYTVNTLFGTCTCEDYEFRQPEGGCKHQRRVEFAVRGVPESIPADVDVDPQLGEHVGTGDNDQDELEADDSQEHECDHDHDHETDRSPFCSGPEWCPGYDSDELACFRCEAELEDETRAKDMFGIDVDDSAGEAETDARSRRAIADGGVVVHEAEGCEVIETDDVFEGPFPEYDRYGNPTGEYYKRCRGCGREVLEDTPESAVSHRDGCRHGGGN